jgi:hypothetical protein
MANTVSDNLHRLIKSLSKPEKRYFKIFCSRHIIGDENNYQILFDAIDRQEVYDEDKLLRKFKDKVFAQRFSITKNRLYGAILKSLDSFHSNSSTEAQLHRQLHAAEILYNKSLYDQSLKLLHGARKVAEKHELFLILAQISRWEKRILEKDHYESLRDATELETLLKGDDGIRKEMATSDAMWNLKSRLFFLLYREGKARSEEDIEKYRALLAGIDATMKESELSVSNKYMYSHIRSAYHYSLGEYSECYPHLTANIALMEEHPHLFDDEPSVYLSSLSNAIYVAMRLSHKKEALHWLERMRSFPKVMENRRNEDMDTRIFTVVHSTELTLLNQTGDFERALALLPEIENGLRTYGDRMSRIRLAHFYFNISVVYFGLERYHDALKWINKLLNQVDIDKARDMHCIAQLVSLIIHLELGNQDVLPYALRSTERFLSTRNKVFEVERLLLEHINETTKKRPSHDPDVLNARLVEALESLQADPYQRVAFEYFDFLAWARSKTGPLSYRDIVAA